jgi:hypothetical protein
VAARPSRIYKAHFVNVQGGQAAASQLHDGGQNYVVGDTGIVLGSSGDPAQYIVNSVSTSAQVATYTLTWPGTGYIPQRSLSTQTGGSQPGIGTGFTVDVTSATPTGQNRNEVKIVDALQYYSHGDLSALALTPDELYPDFNPDFDGNVSLYLWPIISIGPAVLEMSVAANFTQWTLSDKYMLPPGYADAISWALAYRLISGFGAAVNQTLIPLVTQEGTKAELRIREANRINRQLPPGAEILQPPQEAAVNK